MFFVGFHETNLVKLVVSRFNIATIQSYNIKQSLSMCFELKLNLLMYDKSHTRQPCFYCTRERAVGLHIILNFTTVLLL